MRGEATDLCFDCLEQRINSDFSDQIVFSYGLSDSSLPFGSSAVVKVSESSEGVSASFSCESTSSQFILEYLRKEEHGCLANYVDRCVVGVDREGGNSNDAIESDECLDCSTSGSQVTEENITCGSVTCKLSSGSFTCWRTIAALLPIAQFSKCSAYHIQNLASSFLSDCPEDQILASLNCLIDGKSSGQETQSFLRLLGLPLLDEKSKLKCLRHPNLSPVLGLLTSSDCLVSVLPKAPYTLENILYYSPSAIQSQWHRDFMIYQLLSALAHLHGLRVSHGDIRPSNILLSDSLWSWLTICGTHDLGSGDANSSASRRRWCVEGCYSYGLYADLKISSHLDWQPYFDKWWRGEVSNFEYLLALNKLAGRRWGDHTFHPVIPWVIDFSKKPENDSDLGWRDLRKSKWRLAKGDEQLDFTYSTFEFPHHVSDECLSELAVCSYKARRLPLSVLRKAVRSVYEPNEYPSDMQRLYDWTPDECIPEFYCDPRIFCSLHPSMSDLAVPPWASSPEEFIRLHRDALESPHVSSLIHHWIDITFGYKMSGQAAITAKNVMLSSSEPTVPRSVGRRQLFFRPHPVRLRFSREKEQSRNELEMHTFHGFGVDNKRSVILKADEYLEETEEASAFSDHALHLSQKYHLHQNLVESPLHESYSETTNIADTSLSGTSKNKVRPSNISLNYLLEHIEVRDEASTELQDLLLWRQNFCTGNFSKDIAGDIFSIGCVLAELYLMKPLFNTASLATYLEGGDLPELINELPPPTQVLVEACIEQDWTRRPSAKSLLDSPYFSATVRSAHLFAAPLHLLAKGQTRLCYAASFVKQGALKAMGTFVAEMCAVYCFPLVTKTLSDDECELAYVLLKEFTISLTPMAVQRLVLPSIQKILLTTGYSHLKVSLLQDSFVRELWNQIGKRVYLQMIHPLVISNLYNSPDKISASAASVLLIGSSEELGAPVTVHQTILPLISYFGKGICADGIDVLVRIGRLLGVNFIVKQMLPLVGHVVCFCIDLSSMKKPEPVHSWCSLAVTDCLITLDGLVSLISDELLIHELTKGRLCLHVRVLMQKNLELRVLQFAATSLMSICQRIGQELTALHVLPQLKELFDEFAFSEKSTDASDSSSWKIRTAKQIFHPESPIKSHMDLVLLLYPSFASLLGMEKLRQGCPTWLLLEQYLLKHHNWKWEYTGRSSRDNMEARPVLNKGPASKKTPKMLLNGSGRSVPKSQLLKNSNHLKLHIHVPVEGEGSVLNPLVHEPWTWFPSPVACWDGLDIGRFGNPKDEQRWKIRASVLSSAHAHHGALRSLVVSEDECTVFTSGIDPGFKGSVQKWELASLSCVSGYHGHEEVVNDISILSSTGKIASCDGTLHVWNSQTGKLISLFSESLTDQDQASSYLSSKNNSNQCNRYASHGLSSGIFDENLYTCMHYLEYMDQLVVGTGSGALRFIDLSRGQKLQLWRGEPVESGFTSLVSALCSGGSQTKHGDGASVSPSWIAAGFSSGQCRLFDLRESGVISSWRAHDGYVTKLAAPESHLLVSSSLDKTLRIWDLRKSWTPQPYVVKGHNDGVSGFSIWGKDVISISRNNIGIFSLSKSQDEEEQQQQQQRIIPQKLYMAEKGGRVRSDLSTICVLPFSRLFIVGAHDGHFRICC
ncbi:Protein GFS12 [Cardamine amara subsp. amara]|uniref:Protein GFS12 n=1 Tax=Cardamine amara subsp. amara TaxID=228776 RepID=A0ABD0ZT89_CARAN